MTKPIKAATSISGPITPTEASPELRPKTAPSESNGHQRGLITRDEMQTNCCYATQDKTWVLDPDGNEWEVFVVLKDNLPENAVKTDVGWHEHDHAYSAARSGFSVPAICAIF